MSIRSDTKEILFIYVQIRGMCCYLEVRDIDELNVSLEEVRYSSKQQIKECTYGCKNNLYNECTLWTDTERNETCYQSKLFVSHIHFLLLQHNLYFILY
jgi:hypothetical protein